MFLHKNLLNIHQELDIISSNWKEGKFISLSPAGTMDSITDYSTDYLIISPNSRLNCWEETLPHISWSPSLSQTPMPTTSEMWPPLQPVWWTSHWWINLSGQRSSANTFVHCWMSWYSKDTPLCHNWGSARQLFLTNHSPLYFFTKFGSFSLASIQLCSHFPW